MTQLPTLLTAEEAAAELRVSTETLRRWVRQGQMKTVDLPGSTIRIRRSEIERMLAGERPIEATA